MVTMWDDLEIWRYQKYVEHPALARQDAKPYKALRQWAQQFYEVAPDLIRPRDQLGGRFRRPALRRKPGYT